MCYEPVLTRQAEGYKHVRCFGLHGTYDHALEWLKSSSVKDKPKTILWLGSSLGNFKRHEAAPFLAGFGDAIQTGDTMLIGIDSCKDPSRVYHAYNDCENVTHEFILNGLKHANNLMGIEAFKLDDWEVIGEFDETAGRHHAFVAPLKDVVVQDVKIPKGERVRIEESYKYSREEILELWEGAGLAENAVWCNARGDYGKNCPLARFCHRSLMNNQVYILSRSLPSFSPQNQMRMLRNQYRPLPNGASFGRLGMLLPAT